jgi:two-component system cell cycle sensor histidine kinase/response regulator CckA
LSAGKGTEALSIINRNDQHLHLMITDLVMPGMSGSDLASTVSESHPEIKILYTSGYSEHAILKQGVPGGPSRVIEKTYSVLSLRRKVREVLDTKA